MNFREESRVRLIALTHAFMHCSNTENSAKDEKPYKRQTLFTEAASWSRADSEQVFHVHSSSVLFTIMLNFPLLHFAFHTDGYFEEFTKDFAKPEESMIMNLIWIVWTVPKV